MSFDSTRDYPLGTRRPDLVFTPNGVPLADVTIDALRAGRIDSAEIRATRDSQLVLARYDRS